MNSFVAQKGDLCWRKQPPSHGEYTVLFISCGSEWELMGNECEARNKQGPRLIFEKPQLLSRGGSSTKGE